VRDVLFTTLAEQDAVLSAANVKFASAALDFDNMVPKKSNWELKRALKPRLDRLERRTQRALLELAREAAQRQAGSAEGGEQLARSVAGAQLVDSDDDDDQ
jgi:coiled-coil domain-containing protein 12